MKLVVVMPSGKCRGGAEEALLQLAASSRAAGLSLHVVLLEEGEIEGRLSRLEVPCTLLPVGRLREAGKLIRSILALRRILQAEKPAAVLGWMTKAHIYGGLAALGTGVPALYFQMGLPDGGRVDLLSRMLPAAGAMACSEFAATAQRSLVHYPVAGVPLAADHERFLTARTTAPAEMKARLGFAPDQPLIGMVGRLQRWKGMHVFTEAMKRVLEHNPDCRGVIVGGLHHLEPEYPGQLTALVQKTGLADRLRLVGEQSNVPEWMQAFDIVVHASEREPFGIVVVEAMSLGKPVVATIPGGPAEIISDGRDGLLVPYGDPAALSGAIIRFLDDPAFAAACGKAAEIRAQDFTPAKFAANVGSSVAALTAKRHTPAWTG